jgi:redox-sensitive bicupin YhaK (pirin superfamily)
MTKQVKGKMFLAGERGLNETAWLRSWNTFNFGKYYNENKQPVGDVYVLNDDMLDGGRSLSMLVEEDSYIILLPVAGAIAYKDTAKNESLLAAGQVQVAYTAKGTTFEITNPFKEELVNFLQIWIRADKKMVPSSCVSTYDVNEFQNSLIKISPQRLNSLVLPFSVSIGEFAGRGETTYQTTEQTKFLFVFVLAGAFEAEGRLLHERDGLALWGAGEIEMEALSNDAVILLIEQ